jgi:hypothetical protein
MTSRHAASASATATLLFDEGILQQILYFVGAGNFSFVGTVSKLWYSIYTRLPPAEIRSKLVFLGDDDHLFKLLSCDSRTTLASAVFAGPATVAWAGESSLAIVDSEESPEGAAQWHYSAGKYADYLTLRAAEELGLQLDDETLLDGVAYRFNINTLRLLCERHDAVLSDDITAHAAVSGSVEMMAWLSQRPNDLVEQRPKDYAMFNAAYYGKNTPFTAALVEHSIADRCVLRDCVLAGHLELVKVLSTLDRRLLNKEVCTAAALGGHLDLLQYLRTEGCPWSVESVVESAARSGSIPLLQWVLQHSTAAISVGCMREAAGAGMIPMCDYLLSQGCPCDSSACTECADYGQLETLRWLLQHNCALNAAVAAFAAAASGHIPVLQFMRTELGVEWSTRQLCDLLNTAGAHKHLEAAKWFRQLGAEWPTYLNDDSELCDWSGAALKWARSEGCCAPLFGGRYEYESDADSEEASDAMSGRPRRAKISIDLEKLRSYHNL